MIIVLSYFCGRKNNDGDEEANEYLQDFDLNTDEEYLHSSADLIFTYRRAVTVDQLNKAMIYVIFLSLFCFLGYSSRNPAALKQAQHLRSYLISNRNPDRNLNKLRELLVDVLIASTLAKL